MTAAEALLGSAVAVSLALSAFTLWRLEASNRRFRRRAEPAAGPSGGLSRVGIVRFNPYHDTGGEYSFTVALLDGAGSGILLTGLYHRDQCRVYAKPVTAWESNYELTDEERQAIAKARAEEESETGRRDRL